MRESLRRDVFVCLLLVFAAAGGCSRKNDSAPQAGPVEVTVMKAETAPITLYEDYAAQTEAVEAVEIRSRVGGILERQAFKDGSLVKKGDLLFVIDQEPYLSALTQAKANLAQAQAAHVNSSQILKRSRPLSEARAISQQELETAAARERADAAAIEAGKAQVQQAQLNLGYTTIRAPRSGLISRALVKPGGLVNASTTLLTTLYSVDPMYVSFTVGEQRLESLLQQYRSGSDKQAALPIRIRLADGRDYEHGGKLDFVDAAVDPRNGTLPVRLVVPNPDGTLRAGQFVRAILPRPANPNAIMIPQKAVQELQGKHSVFIVGPDNKAVYRDIETSTRSGNNWVVEQGIKPGELVVVEGLAKLKPGVPVKPVMAKDTADGNGKTAPAAGNAGASEPTSTTAGNTAGKPAGDTR
ncbi:efflux RND transporter periplasmic adaptor subunit [Paucimonas lemoignei]|nr:efflux RND transporter periplasmic adaptor subunit [Paucimonas lemoignei]